MGLFGGIVGGALGIGASIFGGVSASRAMKKAKRNLENLQKENDDWYNRRYNEDSTQRADAQRILAATQESIRQRNRQAAGQAAVMGGTDESVAAAKAAGGEALADAASRIAVAGDRRKDVVEQQYLTQKQGLADRLNQMEINKANTVAQAVQGVADAGAGMMGVFNKDDDGGK